MLHDRAVDIVQRITQANRRLKVSGYEQIAREEQGIAILPTVDHCHQFPARSADMGIAIDRRRAGKGAQPGMDGIRLQQQDEGQVPCIYQEAAAPVRSQAGE